MAKQKFTPRPKESEAVITKRWTKKRDSIENLANNVQSLRYNVSLGLKNESKNEKNFLTCLVVALILKTGERVGNSASESNGHVGITGLKKDQLTIIGNKIILEYVGKSGVEHEKMFSDEKIAKALKIAKKNSPDNNIFTTSKGFKIKNVRINNFLKDFSISAKDIRGYSSNNLLVRKLRDLEPEDTEAKRKRQFNKAARFVAKKIGHGLATMKKHYMLPELEPSFVEKSIVIDIDDVSKYNDGGAIKSGKIKVSKSADKFTCKDAVPDSKLKKSLPKEVKEILKEEYNLKKGGDISFNNFHLNTLADYSSIKENQIPNREPDFVSESGSKYWYDGGYVIRQSDHWGELGECTWMLDSESYSGLNQGKCLLSEFKKQNIEMKDGGDIQELGNDILPIGSIVTIITFRSRASFEVVGYIGEREGFGKQYEAYELKADRSGVKGKKTNISFPYPNTKTKNKYYVTLPKEGDKLISQSEIDSEKRRGSESEVIIKLEGDKPSYLMTKDEYKSIVTPKIKEFNKFIENNKEYFSRIEYNGFDYLDFESFKNVHKPSQYSNVERDFLRGKGFDFNSEYKPKQASLELIEKLNSYKDYFSTIFGEENLKKIEPDENTSNKRSIRRAIDSGSYEKLLREGKINYTFLKNVFDSAGVNIPTKLEKIESEVVDRGLTSDVKKIIKNKTDDFIIHLKQVFSKEIRFYADKFKEHYFDSIERMDKFCKAHDSFVNYDAFARAYSLANDFEPKPVFEEKRGVKVIVKYEYHPDINQISRFTKIFYTVSSSQNHVKYAVADNWKELLEERALDYSNALFQNLGERILSETDFINKINNDIPTIKDAEVHILTQKGFETNFSLLYSNGFIFNVETQVIYAGGYNIQALHLRALFKFKYKGKFISKKEILEAYKSFNGDEKTFEKGGLIINEISIPENIDALLKEKYSLDNDVSFYSDEWNKIIGKRDDMGLVPDEVRKSDEYIRLKTKYKLSFKKFQDFNQSDKNKTILNFTKKIDRVTQQKIRKHYLNEANSQDKMLFGGVIDGNTELFETAMSFKKLGFSDEKIFYETGYFIGLDGKWRSEIDDDSYLFLLTENQLLEKYENKSILKLGDLVSHSEFFRVLPKSKDILVNLYDLDDYDFTYFKRNPEENCIAEFNYRLDYPTKFNFYKIDLYVDFKYIKEHGEERKKYPNESSIGLCTLHEMQHILQNQRGNRRSAQSSSRSEQVDSEIKRARIQLQEVSRLTDNESENDKYDLENLLSYLIKNRENLINELYDKDPAEIEARVVVQRFINKDKSFPSELNYSPEAMKNGGSVNPYAVCTTSIGKTEDTQKRSDWSEEGLDKYERCVLKVKAKMSNGGELKIEKKKVYEGDKILRDMPLDEVEKYIGIYHEQEGNIFFAKNRFLIWFYDTTDFAPKINSGEYDFLMFPNRMKGFSFNSVGIIDEIWTSKWQNKFKGAKNLLGMVQGYYDEANNKIVIHFMSVRPSAKRNHINSFMIQYAKKVFNSSDVVFHEPTEQGQSFIDSNRFEQGGDLKNNFKVEVVYDLLAPNGKPSNLTPEQFKLVRSPEFIQWFGDWENDPENASKVVDENGEPLVCYHKTNNKFTIFDKEKLGSSSGWDTAYFGFYFSNKYEKTAYGKIAIKCFLNIKNPYYIISETYSDFDYDYKKFDVNNFSENDGVIIKTNRLILGDKADKHFVAFESNQIKLSNGNNTTFDGSNPDIRFEDGGTMLLAPNGKPSKLSEVQYKLVRTPEFISWFGDWENSPETASKIVDENGEPKVCFHRSKKDFYFFDTDKQLNGWLGKGFYFSDNKFEFKDYGKKILSVFLNIRNPFKVKGESPSDFLYELKQMFDSDKFNTTEILKVNKYDGIIYKHWDYEGNMFVCFESNQIKLAHGSNTTFDSNNPDIRFEDGGDITLNDNFNKWFKNSKVVDSKGNPLVVYHGTDTDFNSFDTNKIGNNHWQSKSKLYGGGFFFTSKKRYAHHGGIIKEVYLKIENPLIRNAGDYYYAADMYDNNSETFLSEAKNNGNDGIIINSPNGSLYIVFNPNQIKLADGTNTTFDVSNPDIRFEDGGGVSFDKVISASTRFRPTETVVFDPPLEGKNGAKLISYTWSYEWTMKPSNEGELVSKRVSDWTQAEISADTGRDIVHQYTILMPDGEYKTVSSDSVPVLLGYLDKKELKSFPNLVTASKTLAKQQMQLAILEAQKKEYDDLYAKFEKAEKPEVKEVGEDSKFSAIIESYKKGAYSNYAMGDVTYRQDNDYVYGTESYKKRPISRTTIEQLTWAWISKRVEENGGVNPRGLYDLKNRVARQKRKVENILNSKMENGGVIVGEEMADNKFPTLDEAYDIIENEESNQGGVWIAEEDSDYSEDAKFQDKEQAMLYVKEIYGFMESISDDDFIPVYRCVSAEEVDLDPYSIGESWSIYLDSAKEFGRHLGEPLSKLKIISGYVPKENVDWENAIRLYHLFSDSSSSESEFELPIPSNNKILNVTVSNFKDAKELPEYNKNYKNGGDIDSNDFWGSDREEEIDYLSGTIVGDVMDYMAYYEVSDTFPETERFILSHEEKIILREKTQDSKDTFKPKGLWYAFGMDWFKGVAYVVPSMAGNYKYVHKLKVTDKVCSIKTIEEAVKFTDKYGVGEGHFYKRYLIDWSKVEKDYSGVEALDPVRWCRTEGFEDKLWWLYSWDAASGCIWKNEGIESVEIYDYKKQAKDFHDELDREQQEYIKSQDDNTDEKHLKKGGSLSVDEKDDVYKDWKDLINMSYSELKEFYFSDEGKVAGLKKSEADELGIHSGRESARWIMKMKKTKREDWTNEMWAWAKRQIGFVKRMSGAKGDLIDEKGNKTRKYLSLLIWGHNPKKSNNEKKMFGGIIGSKKLNYSGRVFVGKDNNWRFEFSDHKAKLLIDINDILDKKINNIPLIHFIQHRELFKAYPELRDVKVVFKSKDDYFTDNPKMYDFKGEFNIFVFSLAYNKTTDLNKQILIYIDYERANKITSTEMYNMVLRGTVTEVQHAIQQTEGFGEERGLSYFVEKEQRKYARVLKEVWGKITSLPEKSIERIQAEADFNIRLKEIRENARLQYENQLLEIESIESANRIKLNKSQRDSNPSEIEKQ